MLQHGFLIAKIRFDTAENKPSKISKNASSQRKQLFIILNEKNITAASNWGGSIVFNSYGFLRDGCEESLDFEAGVGCLYAKFEDEIELAKNTDELLDHLNVLMMAGGMSDDMRGVIADHIEPFDPNDEMFDGLTLEGAPMSPDAKFWLGTDLLGRDLFSRLLYGAQTSLVIGVVANGLALLIGTLVGITAGFFRGWVMFMKLVKACDGELVILNDGVGLYTNSKLAVKKLDNSTSHRLDGIDACACIPPNSFTFKVKEMDLEMFTNKGNQEGYSLSFIK